MAHHERLGEILTAFEDGACLRRTNDRNMAEGGRGLEIVVDAFHQRIFRTYDDHVNGVCLHKTGYGIEIIGLHRHILAYEARAGIAGGDEQLLYFLTLGYFPCQSMFAAARTEEQNFHIVGVLMNGGGGGGLTLMAGRATADSAREH